MLCYVLKRPPQCRGNEIKKRLSVLGLQGHPTKTFCFSFFFFFLSNRLGAGELEVHLISDLFLLLGNKRLFVHNTKTSVCLDELELVTHDLSFNLLFAVMIKWLKCHTTRNNKLERIYEISYI